MNDPSLIKDQKAICKQYKPAYTNTLLDSRLGIALSSFNKQKNTYPIHGLRHPPDQDMNGWYIWAGEDEIPEDGDFFSPLCVEHLYKYAPLALKYLGLAPGWRFLTAPGYEDVWQDSSLLEI